jgi:hypothetical protein
MHNAEAPEDVEAAVFVPDVIENRMQAVLQGICL